ncbi:unnamed protein product [Fusarium fujikuroi]|uniref:Uncharacterized protein n=1 Tax=Fusarium fujikuroi TaxID=5127 RepID=A0A9Q9RVY5_FUSFU|nr:unnamed protein product [Fusarium fujikuroi]VTT73655.1 unnamed protein product [Fusarium fujikuroi]VZH99691.1 unnamed protein product [Fusarium fujikuroi]
MAGGARSKSGVASLKSADLSQTFDAPPSSIDANNSKKTMTSSPSRNSSRVTNDEDETRQKGGTLLLQLGRSAPLDKRHRDVGDEDFDDEASAASMKRGKYMSIKGEPEIDDGSERQPSLYRQQSLQVLQDSRVPPGVPAVERYSTENTGIVDPRYDFMCASRDICSPNPERDLEESGRPSTMDTPFNEKIEPAAIVRFRQEMNIRFLNQEQSHFEELQTVRGEMRAMRSDFEERIFRFNQQHEKAIVDLANEASLAGHDSV